MTQTPHDTQAAPTEDASTSGPPTASRGPSRLLIGVAVLAVFAVIIGVRLMDRPADVRSTGGAPSGASAGLDPVAALDEAIAGGGPVVLLFHSGSCPACVETEQAVESVLPAFPDVAYIEARTDDPRTAPLLARFSFQYVPTLFYLAPGGEVSGQQTGVITPDDARAGIEALAEAGR